MDEITQIIADGSCLGNPGPGGWAAIVRNSDSEVILKGKEPQTTNNRMELSAIIAALKHLGEPREISIKTDSKYVIDGFEKGWVKNWKRNGWKTAAGKPVKNKELWEDLSSLVFAMKTVTWTWVKGHSGDPDNEKVDFIARSEAESL